MGGERGGRERERNGWVIGWFAPGFEPTSCRSLAQCFCHWSTRVAVPVGQCAWWSVCQMISVERVLEYSHLQSEAALESEEKRRPPDDWPDCGTIQADNVCLQYFPAAPVVLKNLTFRIREKEKVNITTDGSVTT